MKSSQDLSTTEWEFAQGGHPNQPTPDAVSILLRSQIFLRWIAVVGQLSALFIVYVVLGFQLPVLACLMVITASIWVNIVLWLIYSPARRLEDTEAMAFFAFDLIQLACLLYLTGGLANPFAILFLMPVTVSASVLSTRSTMFLGAITFVCLSVLYFFYRALPWDGSTAPLLPEFYRAGIWLALVLSCAFTSGYSWRLSRESIRMASALSAMRDTLAREQELASLGGLAAAAAHELGTPLATISVVARELNRELPEGSPMAEDTALMLSQAERCREILASLGRRPGPDSGDVFNFVPFAVLIEEIVEPHRGFGIEIEMSYRDDEADVSLRHPNQPRIARSPEIIHALGNFVENAVGFAENSVAINLHWSAKKLTVTIQDDGPGFSPDILSRIGEPYVTEREELKQGGLGLGVFIAKTLLERTGAQVRFSDKNGARVAVSWDRAIIER